MSTWFDGASTDRVAIVTGGSRGVGRTTTGRLAARGYAVVVNYLHDQQAASRSSRRSSRTWHSAVHRDGRRGVRHHLPEWFADALRVREHGDG